MQKHNCLTIKRLGLLTFKINLCQRILSQKRHLRKGEELNIAFFFVLLHEISGKWSKVFIRTTAVHLDLIYDPILPDLENFYKHLMFDTLDVCRKTTANNGMTIHILYCTRSNLLDRSPILEILLIILLMFKSSNRCNSLHCK